MSNDVNITQGEVEFTEVINFLETGEDFKASVLNRPIVQVAFNTSYLKTKTDILESGKEPKFDKRSAFNKNFGQGNDEVPRGNDPRFTDKREPTAHKHSLSDLTPPVGAVGRLVSNGTNVYVLEQQEELTQSDVSWEEIKNKPQTFISTIDEVVGLRGVLSKKAETVHPHEIGQIIGLNDALNKMEQRLNEVSPNSPISNAELDSIRASIENLRTNILENSSFIQYLVAEKAASIHNHQMSDIIGLTSYIDSKVVAPKISTLNINVKKDGDLFISIKPSTLFKITLNGIDLDGGWVLNDSGIVLPNLKVGDSISVYSHPKSSIYRESKTYTGQSLTVPTGIRVWQVSVNGIGVDFSMNQSGVLSINGLINGDNIIIYGETNV